MKLLAAYRGHVTIQSFLEQRVCSMKIKSVFITILALFSSFSVQADQAKLVIMTEDFPPFNYVEDGKLIGVGPEVVRALMDRMELPGRIKVMSWKRAYNMTLKQPNKILFSMVRSPEREDQFYWVGPLMRATEYFYASAGFSRDSISLEEARNLEGILVQEGGAHQQILEADGFKNLKPYTNVGNQLLLLARGRGELLLMNDLTIFYQLKQLELDPRSVKPVLELQHSDLYIAISRKTDPTIVQAWQTQLDALREEGGFDEILARYLPVMN